MKSKKKLLARAAGLTAVWFMLQAGAPLMAGDVERAVDYRQGVMNVFSWNMKAMGSMMKGETPFDQQLFSEYARELAMAARFNLANGFPEDSESDNSDALAEIWMDFDDFEAKYRDLGVTAEALQKAAEQGDKATLGMALKETGKTCKACHRKYKN